MKARTVLAAVALATVVAPAASANYVASHATESTQNWAGWSLPGHFQQISASWRVINAHGKQGSIVSQWVGFNDQTILQAGTDSLPDGMDYAWFEVFPSPSVVTVTAYPGDRMTVTITHMTGDEWKIRTVDHTNRLSETNYVSYTAPATQAEYIVEAPTGPTGELPLARFKTATFTNATYRGTGVGAVTDITLTQGNRVVAPVPGKTEVASRAL